MYHITCYYHETLSCVAHGVEDALKQFVKHFVPTNSPNVADILYAVDQVVANLPKEDTQKRQTRPDGQSSTRMVVVHQLDSTSTQQHDIEALIGEVKSLREENLQLTAEVAELKSSFSTQLAAVSPSSVSLQTTGSPASTSLQTTTSIPHSSTVVNEDSVIAQAINTLPKTLESFWKQMNEGDDKLCKFSHIPEKYKRDPKTKACYSKRKNVFEYVSNFPGGPQECIKQHGKLSVTRVYETLVKASRKL